MMTPDSQNAYRDQSPQTQSIRDRYLQAVRRQREDYVPFSFSLCPSQEDRFFAMTGQRDYQSYYQFPSRMVYPRGLGDKSRFERFFPDMTDIRLDDWGVGYKSGSLAHFTKMQHPMESFTTIAEFESYPYPDPLKDFDWEGAARQTRQIQASDLVAIGGMAVTIFEIAWYLRGMEQFMIDLATEPELAACHLDRITSIRCVMAGQYAKAGVDILHLGDDVSTQLAMMMHPDTWRSMIKPRLAAVIQAARAVKPDILIFYHGDGNLQTIIPDLIEIGVDILNPIQPECMDPMEIKRLYGDRLTLCGTIGTQSTLPFGTADEVRSWCQKMIDVVGKGGGLLLEPTHMVEPEVPWENLLAFLDVVCSFNAKGEVRA